MSIETKIQQFKTMAEADPDNELGHFSLAKAYLEADRPADAIASFDRVLQLNPGYSKAYQLKAEGQLKLNLTAEAVATLQRGIAVAGERGDLMPRKAMVELLGKLGHDVPDAESAAPLHAGAADVGPFTCTRCGRPSGKLPERPFKGALGERIHREICASCWREWIAMGTKVINELGLVLSDPRAQEAYDQHLKEFLMLE